MSTAYDIASKAPRNARFHIHPRYTPGSPAMIDEYEVCRVAEDEREAHERNLTGVYGEEFRKRAETEGLSHIAYARWEKGRKVYRLDLLTGETMVEPPCLEWDDRGRLLDLRNRKQYARVTREQERELEELEFRAKIHREEVNSR